MTGHKVAWFAPLLAGARSRDRLVAALGGALGIGLTCWIAAFHVEPGMLLFVAAPLGASAVLLFAVPASPMSAPWPVIGGAMTSTASGALMVHLLGATPLAAGLAVGLAIVAMSALRCLHPPGGGYALVPVVAGAGAKAAGWVFILAPVGTNALLLVLSGLAFHRLVSGHSYPHRPVAPPQDPLTAEDIDAALAELGETFDVAREDLDALLEAAARHARQRRGS
ncbi:HPP family protein [Sphingomonas sp.]|uniref:HPP family protein n=1 Tax=Sphingomonas sp. TaxID=28214 RepID=UPI001B2379E1|nr:HPP family protein [Sphingomonas sp.]MBO9712570.1 HPP family protein [Sphingomonas sp.]